ncbi:serine/threonine-protein kinase CTR1 [Impatiens glandulifera]|uniref:serine/threonine-protein kinase CTR1 n=1 Tax=Impatiens glandulifera TaxID=253017 RepID=UPI001FB16EE8|nr:serine/threonine-protein kinase CTR1 [Impatiens glandulifera]
MEMPGRRSTNYTLLSQTPDDYPHPTPPPTTTQFAASYMEPLSGDNNKGNKSEKVFDWDLIQHPPGRTGTGGIGLQRQSSGSSFGGSSISGEGYMPSAAASDPDFYSHVQDDSFKVSAGGGSEFISKSSETRLGGSSSSRTWAQQTEESYQLQLALALRLSSEASCADDPNFLDPVSDEFESRSFTLSGSLELISHRFWVSGRLSYSDKIPDGFYSIHGMDSYVWVMCNDLQESGRIPSLNMLKAVDPSIDSCVEAILVDKHSDHSLKELQIRIHNDSRCCTNTVEIVDHLAKMVCERMGGVASTGEDALIPLWKEATDELKDCLRSVVLPIGTLSVGLCRHRSLLFKVLADAIDLPCRIVKGCKYCKNENASSCLVRFGLEREYLVDLIGQPGYLCAPDSLLNGPSSISIYSPLCFPRFRQVESAIDFGSQAKQYFSDCEVLNLVFDDSPPEDIIGDSAGDLMLGKQLDGLDRRRNMLALPQPQVTRNSTSAGDLLHFESCSAQGTMSTINTSAELAAQNHFRHDMSSLEGKRIENSRFHQQDQSMKPSAELIPDIDHFDIPWSDIILKEKIGAGSFGTVYRGYWHDCEVAVKILMEKDFHPELFGEFLREVAIMKRLRHPNIVLFMGAVTEPPNFSIVTEYLSRGSLYKLLHRPGARDVLDERRRLTMAYDVAKGMNYLHRRSPPIVHRDLKSPNLLVDKKYTVKVCDFGLSRLKANTFLSSKSAAGTPEWMAPEVLRDEPSNEKSDVYSFGVILWELATLQQPWGNLNPAQVVAAVGFKSRRLEIPRDLNHQVAVLIEACWSNEPWKRPSFASIMEILTPLIKPPTSLPVHATDMLSPT